MSFESDTPLNIPTESDDSIDIQNTQIEGPSLATLVTAWDLYRKRQWVPVAIPPGLKGPRKNGWEEGTGTDVEKAQLEEAGNIGLILGGMSGLIDIDLDCPEAVHLAAHFLPSTPLKSGRTTRPDSHWWYKTAAGSEVPSTTQLTHPTSRDMLVELRANKQDGTPGAQTCVAPSVHPDGDDYEWGAAIANLPDPAEVDPEELIRRVHRLGAAVLVSRSWNPGGRHQLVTWLAGALAKLGLDEAQAVDLAVTQANAHPHPSKPYTAKEAEGDIRSTFKKLGKRGGRSVAGFSKLQNVLGGPEVTQTVLEWFALGYGLAAPRATSATNPPAAAKVLAPREEMIGLLTSARDRELSFQELQRRLGVTGRTLRRLLADERQKANRIRILKRGRVGYATLRQGSGLVARSWDDPVAFEMIEAAFLPTGFRKFVGPSKGLPPATMVLYEGLGDAFKSGFLISTAMENAQRRLRTVLVSHEQNLDQLRQLVARRLLGRAPNDSEEARDVCMRTPWLAKNLDLQVVPGTAHVEEFIEDLVHQKSRPEVVVYDYLNQSTMRADHANQQSLLANIVQRLGQGLVDEGIPLITACQLRTEKGVPTAPETWEQRATVVLRVENVRPEDDGRLLAHFLAVRKNKAGYDSHLTKRLKMVVEEASHRILRVEPADEHAIHGQSPQVLAALQPTFSMDELRSLVASRLGKSIADSMVKSLSDELVTGWLALHEIEKAGRDYKKCIPGQGLSDDDDDD